MEAAETAGTDEPDSKAAAREVTGAQLIEALAKQRARFHKLEAASPTGATVAVLSLTWSPGSRYLAAGGSDASSFAR